MISYEAAPGENVTIKGSKIIDTKWEQRRVETDILPDAATYTWSKKIWVTMCLILFLKTIIFN